MERQEETRQLQEAYRAVFGTKEGEIVLADILSMLGFFSNQVERIDPHGVAVGNTILSRIGVFGSDGCTQYVHHILQAGYANR